MTARSFADPQTEYSLVIREVPVGRGGCRADMVVAIKCDGCGNRATNIDEIPHANDCPQRFAHSDWYRGKLES